MKTITHQTAAPKIGDFVCVLFDGVPCVAVGGSAFAKVSKVGPKLVTVTAKDGSSFVVRRDVDNGFGFTSDMQAVDAWGAKAQTPWDHTAHKF